MHVLGKHSQEPLSHKNIHDYVMNNFSRLDKHNIDELVHFHSINKYLLMAHDRIDTHTLRDIVANHEMLSPQILHENYEITLKNTMKKEPTIKTHHYVLLKLFGHFKNNLNDEENKIMLKKLYAFKENKETLNNVLLLLEDLTRKFQKTHLVRQTYFLFYAKVEN